MILELIQPKLDCIYTIDFELNLIPFAVTNQSEKDNYAPIPVDLTRFEKGFPSHGHMEVQ